MGTQPKDGKAEVDVGVAAPEDQVLLAVEDRDLTWSRFRRWALVVGAINAALAWLALTGRFFSAVIMMHAVGTVAFLLKSWVWLRHEPAHIVATPRGILARVGCYGWFAGYRDVEIPWTEVVRARRKEDWLFLDRVDYSQVGIQLDFFPEDEKHRLVPRLEAARPPGALPGPRPPEALPDPYDPSTYREPRALPAGRDDPGATEGPARAPAPDQGEP